MWPWSSTSDICCLKRAFYHQRSTSVQLETAAFAALVEQTEVGAIRLVRSPAHVLETDRNPREDRRLATALWLDGAHVDVALTERAAWLATMDDRLIGLGQKHREALRVRIVNPTLPLEGLAQGEA